MTRFKLLFILTFLLPCFVYSQSLGYNRNRFAISADGNNADDFKDKWPRADEDDWGATPATMAMIAKLKLSDKLVHFSYNNFMEANVGPDSENIMDIGVQAGIQRLRLNPNVFFDVTKKEKEAIESLTAELSKSTKEDPLYFIHMGPSEFFYQCVKRCVDQGHGAALEHVFVVSHSGYNDNHLRRPYHHTMQQAIDYSKGLIHYKRIKDQNASWDPNTLWNSGKDFSVWYWMRDSKDPNIQWLYERLLQNRKGVADISDAGMLYYLLVGDENGSPSKFKAFLGDEIVPNPIVHPTKISTDCTKLLVFVGHSNRIKASIVPELTSNKKVKWESSNPTVATVAEGIVHGLKEGKTIISVITMDGHLKASVKVEIKTLPLVEENTVLLAIKDFKQTTVEGFVPAYIDADRKAIAVDATKYKDKFAAVRTTFKGETGLYDITLKTLRESDGESWYRIKINNQLVGEFRNVRTDKDYVPDFFTSPNITIEKGDIIQIESNTASNFIIPEGKAFAFSRGRWIQVELKQSSLIRLKK